MPFGLKFSWAVKAVFSSPKKTPSTFHDPKKGLQRLSIDKTAKGPVRVTRAAEFVSPHPDAVRRRREADARKLQRQRASAELFSTATGESTEHPANVETINSRREFAYCLSSSACTGRQVVMQFKSSGCQSCARLQYQFKCIARENPGILFVIVDVGDGDGELGQLCEQLGITTVPYFQVYKSGGLVCEGAWGDIDLLKSFVPKDQRVCTVGRINNITMGHAPQLYSKRSYSMDAIVQRKPRSVRNGLDILKDAATMNLMAPDFGQ